MLKGLRNAYRNFQISAQRNGVIFQNNDEKYLRSFNEPVDDIQRSFFQYCCQNRTSNILMQVVENMLGIVLYLPYYLHYRLGARKTQICSQVTFISTINGIQNSIPKEYRDQVQVVDFFAGSLDDNDICFLKQVNRRYRFKPFFLFKIMCRIANFSYIIKNYNPDIIFCSAEYSFTSSILTKYCEEKEVKLYNAMHGEKTFDIRDSFCRFTRFFVWDEYYIKLFHSLRADKTEYSVITLDIPDIKKTDNTNHYTYYLQSQSKEEVRRLKEIFELLKCDYLFRPHPIYTSFDLSSVIEKKRIESFDIPIWQSIGQAGNVVSVDSTVNYQAYLAGINVVIDDISEPEYYKSLITRQYIMLNKPHLLLSDLVEDNKKKAQKQNDK